MTLLKIVTSYWNCPFPLLCSTYHSIYRNFHGSDSWDNLIVWLSIILIRYKLAINITVSPNFRNHVENNFTISETFFDCLSNYIYEQNWLFNPLILFLKYLLPKAFALYFFSSWRVFQLCMWQFSQCSTTKMRG